MKTEVHQSSVWWKLPRQRWHIHAVVCDVGLMCSGVSKAGSEDQRECPWLPFRCGHTQPLVLALVGPTGWGCWGYPRGRHLLPRCRTSHRLSNQCQTGAGLCVLLHCMGPSNLSPKTEAGRWMCFPQGTFAEWPPGQTASTLSLRHLDSWGIKPLPAWRLQTAALPFDEGCWHPAHPRTRWHLRHVQHAAARALCWLASLPQHSRLPAHHGHFLCS